MREIVNKTLVNLINNINVERFIADEFKLENNENNIKVKVDENKALSIDFFGKKPSFEYINEKNINFIKIPELPNFVFYIKNFEYTNMCIEDLNYLFYTFELEPIYTLNNNLSKKEIKKLGNIKKKLIEKFTKVKNKYKNIKNIISENSLNGRYQTFNSLEKDYSKNNFIFANFISSHSTKDEESLKLHIKDTYDFTDDEFLFDVIYCETEKFIEYKNNFETYFNNLLENNDENEIEHENEFYEISYSEYIDNFKDEKYYLNYYLFNLNQNAKYKLIRTCLKQFIKDVTPEIELNYLKGKILFSDLFYSKVLIDNFISIETKNYFNIFVKALLFTGSIDIEKLVEKINNILNENIELVNESKAIINIKSNYSKTIIYNDCSVKKSEKVYKILIPLNSIFFTKYMIKVIDVYDQVLENLNVKIRDTEFSSILFGNKNIKKKLKESSDSNQQLKILSFEKIICKKDKIKRDTLILTDEQKNKSRFVLEDLEFSINNVNNFYELKGRSYIISPTLYNQKYIFENTKNNFKTVTEINSKYINVNDYVIFKNSCNVLPKNFNKQEHCKVLEIIEKEYKNGLYSGKSKALIRNEKGNTTIVPMTMIKKTKK